MGKVSSVGCTWVQLHSIIIREQRHHGVAQLHEYLQKVLSCSSKFLHTSYRQYPSTYWTNKLATFFFPNQTPYWQQITPSKATVTKKNLVDCHGSTGVRPLDFR